jgi:hypothetical protein
VLLAPSTVTLRIYHDLCRVGASPAAQGGAVLCTVAGSVRGGEAKVGTTLQEEELPGALVPFHRPNAVLGLDLEGTVVHGFELLGNNIERADLLPADLDSTSTCSNQ